MDSVSIVVSGKMFNIKFEYVVNYPENGIRKVTSLFNRTKRKMLKKDKQTCFICGTCDELEVHHFHVEWALTNCIDWEVMKIAHPTFDWSTFKKPVDFVDSEYNLSLIHI